MHALDAGDESGLARTVGEARGERREIAHQRIGRAPERIAAQIRVGTIGALDHGAVGVAGRGGLVREARTSPRRGTGERGVVGVQISEGTRVPAGRAGVELGDGDLQRRRAAGEEGQHPVGDRGRGKGLDVGPTLDLSGEAQRAHRILGHHRKRLEDDRHHQGGRNRPPAPGVFGQAHRRLQKVTQQSVQRQSR
jgi:hypothetical protein